MKIFASCLLLVTLVCVAFFPSLQNDFTNLDDPNYVTHNALIRDLSPQGILKIFTTFHDGLYKPVTILSFAIDYRFFELKPLGYHLTNLLFHILNGLLVFWFIYLLSRRQLAVALMVGVMFAVHPLRVESVAWVSERKDVLYAFFFLTCLVSYLYALRTKAIRYRILIPILFVASLSAKTMGVTLPVILLLIDYHEDRKDLKLLCREKIPIFVLAVAFMLMGVVSTYIEKQVQLIPPYPNTALNLWMMSYAPLFYLSKIFAPVNLSCIYPSAEFTSGVAKVVFKLSPLVVMGLFFVLKRKIGHKRKVLFGILFFLVTLIPVSQIIRTGPAMVADRYTYVASIGIFYIIALAIYQFWSKQRTAIKYVTLVSVSLLIGVYASLTWQRCQVWQNSMTLWDAAIETHPNFPLHYLNRAKAYRSGGYPNQAIQDLNRAISLDPVHDTEQYYGVRGLIYFDMRQYQAAIKDFTTTLLINAKLLDILRQRGIAYLFSGQLQPAIDDFSQLLAARPADPNALNNRGVAYMQLHEFERAARDFSKVLQLEPNSVFARQNLMRAKQEMEQ